MQACKLSLLVSDSSTGAPLIAWHLRFGKRETEKRRKEAAKNRFVCSKRLDTHLSRSKGRKKSRLFRRHQKGR